MPAGEPHVCGTCVHWNGCAGRGDTEGDCPFHGKTPANDTCVRWFSMDQMRAPAYGRKEQPKLPL